MEVSAWYEGQYRTGAGAYGLDGDRVLEPRAELFWGRGVAQLYIAGNQNRGLIFP